MPKFCLFCFVEQLTHSGVKNNLLIGKYLNKIEHIICILCVRTYSVGDRYQKVIHGAVN
jgi:hypothetical protein